MDPNCVSYGYTPVYHQLQTNQPSPDSQNQQQYSPLRPQSTQPNETTNQTVPTMSTYNIHEMPMKTEKSEQKPIEQHQNYQESPVMYQNDQYSYRQHSPNFQNHQNQNFQLPSIFNPNHFQPMPIWHGNENGFGYPQVVPQYPSVNYHPQSYDPRFMMRPPMGYQACYVKPNKSPAQTYSPQISPVNYQQQTQQQPQHEPLQENRTFSCTDCNKTFMSATNLKRHLTTRIHFNKVKKDNPNCNDMIVMNGEQNIEVRYMELQQQQSGTSITDLSEAEVVLIDKIDKELSSIEPSNWSVLKVEPMPSFSVTSPIPVVSSTQSISSPDTVEEFRCNICNKTFAKRCYFTQHNKTAHVGHKPFKCVKCGKKYQTQELLDDHMSKHSGDKPFKCEVPNCPKSFNHKTDLKRHTILHTTEKPHVCQQCGKGFVRKDHLQKHMGSHMRKMEKLKRVFTGGMQVKIEK